MNYMTLGYENMLTIFLAIIGFVVTLWAQININRNYAKYKQEKNKSNLSGCEVARKILDANGLGDVHVVEVNGNLSDHYDPSRKVVRLSRDIFHGNTIAAISVAAHECGHAIQDKEDYKFMKIRSALVPFVNLVSYLGYFVLIISLFAGITGYLMAGIIMILATLIFQLVTLPVEFDASKRAGLELKKLNLLDSDEETKVSEMLKAAAMTYVASVISSVLNLLRLIIMFSNNDRD